MRKNFGAKPILYPMPVLVIATYNEDGSANAMTAAWGTIADTDRIAIYISGTHKTLANILKRKAFTVSFADEKNVIPADYVGILSGNMEADKVSKTGWHLMKSEFVDAPLIKELLVALECRFISFDEASELMIGEIINVCADESVLDYAGKIDPTKLRPISYDPMNNDYYVLGEKVGNAFKDGMKLK